MMRRAVVIALVLTVPLTAMADSEMLGLQIRAKVQIGGDKPAFVITPQIGIKSLKIALKNQATGRTTTLRTGRVGRGRTKALGWKQGVGTQKWEATFHAQWAKGDKDTWTITLESTVYPKIQSNVRKSDVNLDDRSITVRLNQPAARVDLKVWGDDAKVFHEDSTDFEDMDAGQDLEVTWEQPDGVGVLKIELKVWSTFGFWIGTEISPFEVDIPHDDVEFDFGKSNVRPSEAPKIDATMEMLNKMLRRYGSLVKLQLYVAGFTDSVGSKASNQSLSEQRARSIGAYFRRKGIKVPIYFKGFGETHQAVKTPDETKEARNRRAVYKLSAGTPRELGGAWRRL